MRLTAASAAPYRSTTEPAYERRVECLSALNVMQILLRPADRFIDFGRTQFLGTWFDRLDMSPFHTERLQPLQRAHHSFICVWSSMPQPDRPIDLRLYLMEYRARAILAPQRLPDNQ